MIISFNTGKINTTGGKEVALQQKKVTVTSNGLDVIIPDAGYDGISTVYVKTDVGGGGSSFKDFSSIGYDEETSFLINKRVDDDIAYSKTLYDAWNPETTTAISLYSEDYRLVYAPAIDTSNVTGVNSMYRMFAKCTSLKYIPLYNTAKSKSFSSMFGNCYSLYDVDLSKWDVSSLTDISNMFEYCYNLYSLDISTWDLQKLSYVSNFVTNCYNLQHLRFGKNLKKNVGFYNNNLTDESLFSIMNGLYDFTGNGETPTSSQGTISFGTELFKKVTEEQIAIATAKGWTVKS